MPDFRRRFELRRSGASVNLAAAPPGVGRLCRLVPVEEPGPHQCPVCTRDWRDIQRLVQKRSPDKLAGSGMSNRSSRDSRHFECRMDIVRPAEPKPESA